jgi:hypothetical protein
MSFPVKYIGQSDNISLGVLGFDTKRFRRLIADWSDKNINPELTLHGMSLDVSV